MRGAAQHGAPNLVAGCQQQTSSTTAQSHVVGKSQEAALALVAASYIAAVEASTVPPTTHSRARVHHASSRIQLPLYMTVLSAGGAALSAAAAAAAAAATVVSPASWASLALLCGAAPWLYPATFERRASWCQIDGDRATLRAREKPLNEAVAATTESCLLRLQRSAAVKRTQAVKRL